MATRAADLRNFVRVRKILDGRVAISTTHSAVHAGGMLGRVNRDAFATPRRHSGLAVTGEAAFILLQRLGRFWLGVNPSRDQYAD